jgi:hypothetical protein
MWILVAALLVLGIVALTAGAVSNRRQPRTKAPGQAAEPPHLPPSDAACCGAHALCERERLLAAATRKRVYYDDQELDAYAGTRADAYTPAAQEEFRQVFYTMQEGDVPGWVRSLQLRGIELPEALKDEVMLVVGEQHSPPV